MTTLVGARPWSADGLTWPVGTQVGDTAVLAILHRGSKVFRRHPGWARVGGWTASMISGGASGLVPFHCDVYSVTVSDLSAPPAGAVREGVASVAVFRGTAGTGRVRFGIGEAPARSGGAVVTVYRTLSTAAVMPGVVDLAGAGESVAPSWLGNLRTFARLGWEAAPTDGVYGGDALNNDVATIELLPPVGPASPSLLAPEAGNEVAAGLPVTFEWRHRASIPGGFQNAYQLRVNPGTGWQFWAASTGTLTGTETTNLSAVSSVSVPWSQFIADAEASWQVRTREGADGQWSGWSEARSFTAVTPPTVSVTAPVGPVVADLTPTVAWSRTTPRGQQTAFRVQVVRDAVVIYDSGVVPGGGTSHTVPAQKWVNGEGVQARVQIQQTGGSWSAWGTSDFTVSWTPPVTPTVTAVPLTHGVEVTLAGVVAGQRVELQRLTREGLWEVVSFIEAATDDPVVVDFLGPWAPTAYRAMSSDVLDGQPMTSGWGQSGPVTSTDRRAYLALASRPLTSAIPVLWAEDSEHEHQQDVAVGYGMGDRRPRTAYGIERGRAGSWSFHTLSHDDTTRLLDLLSESEPLILRRPPELAPAVSGGGGRDALADAGTLLVKRTSPLSEARYVQRNTQVRTVSFSWVEADPVDPDEVIGVGMNRDGTLTIATDLVVGPGGTITLTV